MRLTKQQQILEDIFEHANSPLTAHEAWKLAQERLPRIGQATVYRQLQAALERGWLRQVDMPGKAARFEKKCAHHRHYFICRICNELLALKGCPGNIQSLVPDGCVLESHEIVLYGKCCRCLNAS